MKIERIIPTHGVGFEKLKIGECFVLEYKTDAFIFLKVDSNNSRKNAVNLSNNLLIEVSSSDTVVFPIKATLSVEL